MARKSNKSYVLNSYVMPVQVMNEMDNMILYTHKTGKEHGMSLCSDSNNNLTVGFKSVGTERGISISERCRQKNEKYIGTFHTHPDDSEAAPSAQDLFSSCMELTDLDCIGKNKKGEIVCYAKKVKDSSCVKSAEPLKSIEDIFSEVPPESLPTIKEDLYEEVDKLADKHFNIHKVK